MSELTLRGRLAVAYTGFARHVALIQQGREHGAELGTTICWYDQPHKQFYLLVSVTVEVPTLIPELQRRLVGVDVGQRYLTVATETQNTTRFFAGKEAHAQADHYARLQKRLQQKGIRSAPRRLVVVSGARETVEARVEPLEQPADRGRVSAQPDWPGGLDPPQRTDPHPPSTH